MLRWLENRKVTEPPDKVLFGKLQKVNSNGEVTDDPLAAIDSGRRQDGKRQIYSVSRSVLLPRVSVNKSTASGLAPLFCTGGGVNPLFKENEPTEFPTSKLSSHDRHRHNSPQSGEKSSSSGYCGSHRGSNLGSLYVEQIRLSEDGGVILEKNPAYVKSIKVVRNVKSNPKSVPSSGSGSTASGTLTTIPEGKVDLPIPRPIWPQDGLIRLENYDSLVDEALLLYTSLNQSAPNNDEISQSIHVSVTELLVDLLRNISATMEGKTNITPEEMLKMVNDKIATSLEALKNSTEEDMKKLCINLRNCKKVNSVIKAFSNSSGSSPEWSDCRIRSSSSDGDEFYQSHSSSLSSSAFGSDSVKGHSGLPVFAQELPQSAFDNVRDVMFCRSAACTSKKLVEEENCAMIKPPKTSLLKAVNDEKPSVWEQYYGVKATQNVNTKYVAKPTDVPIFPGGRPEADFTLDVPRSEHLTKKMRKDKKWRCRCRLLTSFLGLVFFLLSVMAVSLMLTRGKRMFGSMV